MTARFSIRELFIYSHIHMYINKHLFKPEIAIFAISFSKFLKFLVEKSYTWNFKHIILMNKLYCLKYIFATFRQVIYVYLGRWNRKASLEIPFFTQTFFFQKILPFLSVFTLKQTFRWLFVIFFAESWLTFARFRLRLKTSYE